MASRHPMSLMAPRHSLMTLIGTLGLQKMFWGFKLSQQHRSLFTPFDLLCQVLYANEWGTFYRLKVKELSIFSNINLKLQTLISKCSSVVNINCVSNISLHMRVCQKKLASGNGRKWAELDLFSRVFLTVPTVCNDCCQVSEERISVCRDSLEKQCGEDTVGETVCKVIYQTQCNTR